MLLVLVDNKKTNQIVMKYKNFFKKCLPRCRSSSPLETAQSILVLVGGVLIHLTLGGTLYSFGNIMTYMASYMHFRVDSNITYSKFIWVNAATMAFQGVFSVFGGKIDKQIGSRLTCILGSALMCSGIYLTRYTINISLWYVMLTYGVLTGAGIAVAYIAPLGCGMKWYPGRKGLVTGIIVGGFGLGALGTSPLQSYFLNPQNIPVGPSGYFEDDSILDKVPEVFLMLIKVFSIMQITGCLLLSKPKVMIEERESFDVSQSLNLLESEESDNDQQEMPVVFETKKKIVDARFEQRDWKTAEIIRHKYFGALFLIYVSNSCAVGFISTLYKTLGQTIIANDRFLSNVGAIAAVFNCAGRIFWGYYMDITSFRSSMLKLTLLLTALIVSLPQMGGILPHGIGFALWVYMIFFTFSGNFVIMATVVEKAYGSTHFAANYGMLFLSQLLSAPLAAGCNQYLLENFGYQGCAIFSGCIVFAGTLSTLLIPKKL